MTTIIATDLPRAWADVDLGAVVHNARTIAAITDRPLLPMVKANGYGLGAVPVARALEAVAPWGFGVATPAEGADLRRAGITRPVIVFTPMGEPDVDACLTYDLRPAIGHVEALRLWLSKTERPFHVEIDTGMSRGGIRWDDSGALRVLAEALKDRPGAFEGIFTHFHSADCNPSETEAQWRRLEGVVAGLPYRPAMVHAANSAAALCGARYAGDLVRPGIFLYGGSAGESTGIGPRPVVRLSARVVAVRQVAAGGSVSYGAEWQCSGETCVATLGIGYADGLHRSLSGRGAVELGGQRVPIAGRITMDMTMVSVPNRKVAVGDTATIYGGLVSLDEQAAAAGTISYELLTALGTRVARYYRSPDA